MTDKSNTQAAPYGYCPECGEPGVMRERRPDGDDKCVNGHRYPSQNAHNAQPTHEPVALQGRDDENLVAMAWNTVRAEARTLIGPTGLSGLLAAVEQYGDRRAAQAARASLPAGFTPEQVAELVAARDKILAASLPAGGVVEPWGWAIVDKHGTAQAIRPRIKEFFGSIQGQQAFTQEDVKKMDREWPGLVPHCLVTLYTTPQPSETQGRRQMTEEELVACLVKSSCIGKVKMSYESGPYSITRPSLDATRLKDAIEAHHGIPASPHESEKS